MRTLARRWTKRSNYSASTRTVESRWRCGSTSKTWTPRLPNSTPRMRESKREVHRQARQLDNAATQAYERFHANFSARDWDRMRELLADDYCGDDRRRVVGNGIRHGRDAHDQTIKDCRRPRGNKPDVKGRSDPWRAPRPHSCGVLRRDEKPETFGVDVLQLVEIDADQRIMALLAFDLDD